MAVGSGGGSFLLSVEYFLGRIGCSPVVDDVHLSLESVSVNFLFMKTLKI